MSSTNLLFPHQLFSDHPMFENDAPVIVIEEYLFFKQYPFHKSKIVFHRASMKYHQNLLESMGVKTEYIDASSELSDIRRLIPHLAGKGIKQINFVDPTDDWLSRRLKESAQEHKVECSELESPLFINKPGDLQDFFRKNKTRFFQTTFYKQQRRKHNVLIEENGDPFGGKWSFDQDNRKKYPQDKVAPDIEFPKPDKYWDEAQSYVVKNFPEHVGAIPDWVYPHTHEQAQDWFINFLYNRFHHFGDYEDAIQKDQSILHHSLLSPLINTGLLSPTQVIEEAIDFGSKHDIPINSLEGFIRQILGWREFIRGMYECKGVDSRTKNFWGFNRKLPQCFYDATTGIGPVDQTIKKVWDTGYCHHIERLMILGNFMLLCEIDPDDVYRWFMEMFVDAYDWVMVPNVYGMSQFSDGGLFATKPYISGSNYIRKMSDYPRGEWADIWDGMFWRFMDKQRGFFNSNPRLSMLVGTFDKMSEEKQKKHLERAESYLSTL